MIARYPFNLPASLRLTPKAPQAVVKVLLVPRPVVVQANVDEDVDAVVEVAALVEAEL